MNIPETTVAEEIEAVVPVETEFRVQINMEYMEAVLRQASETFGNMPTEEMYVTLKYIVNHMQTALGFPEVTFENKTEVVNDLAE